MRDYVLSDDNDIEHFDSIVSSVSLPSGPDCSDIGVRDDLALSGPPASFAPAISDVATPTAECVTAIGATTVTLPKRALEPGTLFGPPSLPMVAPFAAASSDVEEPRPAAETGEDSNGRAVDAPKPKVPVDAHPRQWIRRGVVGLAVVALASVSLWGQAQHSSAAKWKQKAVELDADLVSTGNELQSTRGTLTSTEDDLSKTKDQLADTQAELVEIQAQLDGAATSLKAAQGELADLVVQRDDLTAQIGTLANDKAQIEDEREQLAQVLATAPAVTSALQSCLVNSVEISRELLAVIADFPYTSLDGVGELIDTATIICQDANTKAADFEMAVEAIGL